MSDVPMWPDDQPLVARIVIDSLGRKWNSLLHPRDRKGRFIETFAEVRAFLTSSGGNTPDLNGIVEGIDPDGTAVIRVIAAPNAGLVGRRVRVPFDKLENVPLKARIGKDNRPHWFENPAPAPFVKRLVDSARAQVKPQNRAALQQYFDKVLAADNADAQFLAVRDLIDQLDKAGEPDARDRVWDVLDELRGSEAKANLAKVEAAPERPKNELPADAPPAVDPGAAERAKPADVAPAPETPTPTPEPAAETPAPEPTPPAAKKRIAVYVPGANDQVDPFIDPETGKPWTAAGAKEAIRWAKAHGIDAQMEEVNDATPEPAPTPTPAPVDAPAAPATPEPPATKDPADMTDEELGAALQAEMRRYLAGDISVDEMNKRLKPLASEIDRRKPPSERTQPGATPESVTSPTPEPTPTSAPVADTPPVYDGSSQRSVQEYMDKLKIPVPGQEPARIIDAADIPAADGLLPPGGSDTPPDISFVGGEARRRGISRNVKRNQGVTRQGDRVAVDKNGVVLKRGSIVNVPAGRKAQGNARPALDGAVVMGIAPDGRIKVYHYDEKYRNEAGLGNEDRVNPYKPFKVAPNLVENVDLDLNRAEALRQKHLEIDPGEQRQMAGPEADRNAPIFGKNAKVPEGWEGPVPVIDDRYYQDANGRLVGKGDWVQLPDGRLGYVERPNLPWDLNFNPRLRVRPEGGGKYVEVQPNRVQLVRDPNFDLFLRNRGNDQVYAPTPEEAASLAERYGFSDAFISALRTGNGQAVRDAALKDNALADFLADADRKRADFFKLSREGKLDKNPGLAKKYQDNWHDAMALRAAYMGVFANPSAIAALRDRPEPLWKLPNKDKGVEAARLDGPAFPTPAAPAAPSAPEATPEARPAPTPEAPAAPAENQHDPERVQLLVRQLQGIIQGVTRRRDMAAQNKNKQQADQLNAIFTKLDEAGKLGFRDPDKFVSLLVEARDQAGLAQLLDVRKPIDDLRIGFEAYLREFNDGAFNPEPNAPAVPTPDAAPATPVPAVPAAPATPEPAAAPLGARDNPGAPVAAQELGDLAVGDQFEMGFLNAAAGPKRFVVRTSESSWRVVDENGNDLKDGSFNGTAGEVADQLNDFFGFPPVGGPATPEVPAAPAAPDQAADNRQIQELLNALDALPQRIGGDKLVTAKQQKFLKDIAERKIFSNPDISDRDKELVRFWVNQSDDGGLSRRAASTLISNLMVIDAAPFVPAAPEAPKPAVKPLLPAGAPSPVQMDLSAADAVVSVPELNSYRLINAQLRRLESQVSDAVAVADTPELRVELQRLEQAVRLAAGARKSEKEHYIDKLMRKLTTAIGAGWEDGVDLLGPVAAWKAKAESFPSPEFDSDQSAAFGEFSDLYKEIAKLAQSGTTREQRSNAAVVAGLMGQLVGIKHPNLAPFISPYRQLRQVIKTQSFMDQLGINDVTNRINGALGRFSPDWETYQGKYTGAKSREERNAMIVADLKDLKLSDLRSGKEPPGWKYIKNDFAGRSGTYNGIAILQDLAGNRIVLKYDGDKGDAGGDAKGGKGANAELDIAMLYRAFGFKQPEAIRIGTKDSNSDERDLFFMDFAGEEFALDRPKEIADVAGPAARADVFANQEEILKFVAANSVMLNTDRHGGNIMVAKNADGKYEIIPIDNGLALKNGAFGGIAQALKTKSVDQLPTPLQYAQGKVRGNRHYFTGKPWRRGHLQQYIESVGRDKAISVLEEWAAEMRRVYEENKQRLQDQEHDPIIAYRIDWLANNAAEFIDGVIA